jgi:hypothetical protein
LASFVSLWAKPSWRRATARCFFSLGEGPTVRIRFAPAGESCELPLCGRIRRCGSTSFTSRRAKQRHRAHGPDRTEAFSPEYGWIDPEFWVVRNRSAVGSRQQNRLAYRFGFSVEFRTRLTKDWDILNVRAMAIGLIPARNDARMRFAFPSGISSTALVVLSETGTDWSFAEVPATGGVAPFFFASP